MSEILIILAFIGLWLSILNCFRVSASKLIIIEMITAIENQAKFIALMDAIHMGKQFNDNDTQ